MIKIDVSRDLARFARDLPAHMAKQARFGAMLAINEIATKAVAAEKKNLDVELDRPTPFTKGAVRMQKATKASLTATIFVQDKTARILEPYVVGGRNVLNSKALLKPKGQGTNQYGNLPRRALASLTNRSDIFIGKVKTKNGVLDGVWQRSQKSAQVIGKKGLRRTRKGLNDRGKLRLLIAFTDAHRTQPILHWGRATRQLVKTGFTREFERGLGKAMATARR